MATVGHLAAAALGLLIVLLIPVGDQRWYAGTFRLSGWWRRLPLYVSPILSGTRGGCPWRPGIAIGAFGRVVYVARLEKR